MKPIPKVKIYTDGSCLKKPNGPGGIGVVIVYDDGAEIEIPKGTLRQRTTA